jgi:hypothetical protein
MWSRKLSKRSPSYSNNISNIPSHECSFAIAKMDKDGKKGAVGTATIVEADHIDEAKSNASKSGSNREVSTKIEDHPDMSGVDGAYMKMESSDFLFASSLLGHSKDLLSNSEIKPKDFQVKEVDESNVESPKTARFSLKIQPKIEIKANKSLLSKIEVGKFMSTFKSGVTKTIGVLFDKNTEGSMLKSVLQIKSSDNKKLEHSSSVRGDIIKKGQIKSNQMEDYIQSACDHRRTNSDTFKFPSPKNLKKDESIVSSARGTHHGNQKTFQPFKTQEDRQTIYESSEPIESGKLVKKNRKSHFKSDDSTKEFKKINPIHPGRKAIGKKIPLVVELEKEVKGLKKENIQLKAENETIKKVFYSHQILGTNGGILEKYYTLVNVIQRNLGGLSNLRKAPDSHTILDQLESVEDCAGKAEKVAMTPSKSSSNYISQPSLAGQITNHKKSSKDLRNSLVKKSKAGALVKDSKLKGCNGLTDANNQSYKDLRSGLLSKKTDHTLSAKDVRKTSKK